MKFTIPGEPVAQPRQQHAIRKKADGSAYISNYTSDRHPVQAYKQAVALVAKQHCRTLIAGPVELVIDFYHARPKSVKGQSPYKITKPDADNLAKAILDALTGIAYKDDNVVFRLVASKYYAGQDEQPRTEVTINEF